MLFGKMEKVKPGSFDRLTAGRQQLGEADTEGDHGKASHTSRNVPWKATFPWDVRLRDAFLPGHF